ncbi:MAG: CehA/McbA family metallohydrolase [Deltaproteobacteria bacterium]|nr:CehA/McbA family metallohydrolase [Deltaproteobacteria bacterium]
MQRAAVTAVTLAVALFCLSGCEAKNAGAYARRITTPEELIGGPSALGQVGDFIIGNSKFRVIIQDQGWSRGFGIFGGGIIDADLERPGAVGTAGGGKGRDNFGELFPALFLQAFDVEDQTRLDPATRKTVQIPGIEVIKDGAAGGDAVIRTRASGGDFLTLVSELLGAAIPQRGLRFETDYVVHPGTRHVEIVGRLLNAGGQAVELPDPGLATLLQRFGVAALQVPLGDVTLFGEGNDVYAPGAVERAGAAPKPVGFDLRFSVDASYAIARSLPALPGLVVDFLATAGPDVSYGFAVADHERNYVAMNRGEYEKDHQVAATLHSMLVPFLMESFAGAYSVVPPSRLEPEGQPGDTFEYTRYFIVGNGDVASIRDELYAIRGQTTAQLSGRVVNRKTGQPETEASVHILDAERRPYSQVQTDKNGRFVCALERGTYYYRVTAPGRYPYPEKEELDGTRFDTWRCDDANVTAIGDCAAPKAKDAEIYVELPAAARVAIEIRDASGRSLPAKVSVVSTYPDTYSGKDPMTFLFDFSLNEARRATDLTWVDGGRAEERRFVEQVEISADGLAVFDVRPSCTSSYCYDYDLYVSRGPEYDRAIIRGLRLEEGRKQSFAVTLTRTVDTENWVSTDLHVHSINSVDSFMPLDGRVTAAAAEGLEIAVATDHNYVTDYTPVIGGLGLSDWMAGVVGVELSTLEMGHFNAFPLEYDISSPSRFPFVQVCNRAEEVKVNKTAFDWVQCAPQQLFDNVRALGRYGRTDTVVQVNHARDTVLGYYNQYFLNPYTAAPEVPTAKNYPETAFFIYPHDRVPGQYSPESFSWSFDAMEVLNGKRLDQIHAFKVSAAASAEEVARLQDVCQNGHQDNGVGKVRLRNGGYPAYPGAMEDWLHLLNAGYTFTATGNSDSHKLMAEVGTPRTYLYVQPAADGTARDAAPAAIHELDLVDAIKRHRALVTNGPFLDMAVVTTAAGAAGDTQTWHVGDTVPYAVSNAGRQVKVAFILKSAPWVKVSEIVVYANGEVLDRIEVPDAPLEGRDIDVDDDNTFIRYYAFERDTVLVAEAQSHVSMFPIVTPKEDPPTNIGDALGGIASGLGLGNAFARGDGKIAPAYVQKVTPYAVTNPIWLDIDASGVFDAPGNPIPVAPARDPLPGECPEPAALHTEKRPAAALLNVSQGAHFGPGDIRRLFAGLD